MSDVTGAATAPFRVMRIIGRLNVGGPAKHVLWLNRRLGGDFTRTLVCGSVAPGEAETSLTAAEEARVTRIAGMSRAIGIRDVVVIWKLVRMMRSFSPSIVHTHTAKAGAVGRIAASIYNLSVAFSSKRVRCRIIHTFHGHVLHSYYGRFLTFVFVSLERLLARVTDRIVVISERQLREINGTFRIGRASQFRIIPLGIDLPSVTGDREARQTFRNLHGFDDSQFVVGIVGRLTDIKNHEMFLAAAHALQKTESTARFVIIGDGLLRGALEQRARALGLGEVVFTGMQHDPRTFFPALDLVVLTSLNEGTPLSLIEGMANGIPAVATNVGGVADLAGRVEVHLKESRVELRERFATVESRDVEAFVEAVRLLIRDVTLRRSFALRGRQFVEEHYSLRRLVADTEALYRQLQDTSGTVAFLRKVRS